MKLTNGVIAMLVTPFHDDYRLNEEALRKEVRWALDNGAEGVVAAPSIGEFLHLNEAERQRVFEIVIEEARKRPQISAVAMTSGATTLEALRYAKIAARLGYDAQQVIPPYYWRCGELEVERHYSMIAEAGDLPVSSPQSRAEQVQYLATIRKRQLFRGVVAFKEVLTDLQHLEARCTTGRCAPALQHVSARSWLALMLGAPRFINIFAVPASVALLKAFRSGDLGAPRKFSAASIDASRAVARKRSAIWDHQGHRHGNDRNRDGSRAPPTWRPAADAAERLLKRPPALKEML